MMTHTKYDFCPLNGMRKLSINGDVDDNRAFVEALKKFIADNQAIVQSLDIEGYLTDAVSDAEYALEKFEG